MNMLLSALGLLMIASANSETQRTLGVVMAGAGLNDILREHRDS